MELCRPTSVPSLSIGTSISKVDEVKSAMKLRESSCNDGTKDGGEGGRVLTETIASGTRADFVS